MATVAAISAAPTMAATISVTAAAQSNDIGRGSHNISANLTAPVPIGGLVADVGVENVRFIGNRGSDQTVEVGLSKNVVGPVWVRAGTGIAFQDFATRDDFGFYNVSVGLTVPVVSKVAIDASVKYQNSFAEHKEFQTVTTGVGATYAVSTRYTVRGFVNREVGDGRDSTTGGVTVGLHF
jgi:hypothetical protein